MTIQILLVEHGKQHLYGLLVVVIRQFRVTSSKFREMPCCNCQTRIEKQRSRGCPSNNIRAESVVFVANIELSGVRDGHTGTENAPMYRLSLKNVVEGMLLP
jgi:hypothetical protein